MRARDARRRPGERQPATRGQCSVTGAEPQHQRVFVDEMCPAIQDHVRRPAGSRHAGLATTARRNRVTARQRGHERRRIAGPDLASPQRGRGRWRGLRQDHQFKIVEYCEKNAVKKRIQKDKVNA